MTAPLALVQLWMFPVFITAYGAVCALLLWMYKNRRTPLAEHDAAHANADGKQAENIIKLSQLYRQGILSPVDFKQAKSRVITRKLYSIPIPNQPGDAARRERSQGLRDSTPRRLVHVVLPPSSASPRVGQRSIGGLTPRPGSTIGGSHDSFDDAHGEDLDGMVEMENHVPVSHADFVEWGESEDKEITEGIQDMEEDIRKEEKSKKSALRKTVSLFIKRQLLGFTYIIKEFGTEAGLYLCCVKLISRFFLLASCAYIPVVLWYYFRGARQGDLDLANFTAANLAPASHSLWIFVLATVGLHLGTQLFTGFQWRSMQRLKKWGDELDNDILRAHTLMIQNTPPMIENEDELFWMMQKLLPNQITGAHIALDLHDLVHNKRLIESTIHELERASGQRCTGRKVEKLLAKLRDLRAEEFRLEKTPKRPTGTAFLSFRTMKQARQFRKRHRDGKLDFTKQALAIKSPVFDDSKEGAGRVESLALQQEHGYCVFDPNALLIDTWKITIAPASQDIIWENLRIDSASRRRNKAMVEGSMVLLLLICCVCCMVGVVCIGFHYVDLMYNIKAQYEVTKFLDDLFNELGWGFFLVALLPPLFFVAIIASIPALAQAMIRVEAQLTRSSVLESYVSKVFAFFLLSNLCITSLGWLIIAKYTDTSDGMRVFIDISGTFHISLILMECFIFIPFRLYRGWNLLKGHYWVKPSWHSMPSPALPFNPTMSIDEVDLEAETLLFDFSRQYGEMFSILAMVLSYSPIIPFILPLGWFYFWFMYQMDSKILREQFGKHKAEDRRVRTINNHMFLCTMVAQIIPLPFCYAHGTKLQIFVMIVFFVYTCVAYAVYIDRSFNDGKHLYRKLETVMAKTKLKKTRDEKSDKKARRKEQMLGELSIDEEALEELPVAEQAVNSPNYYNPLLAFLEGNKVASDPGLALGTENAAVLGSLRSYDSDDGFSSGSRSPVRLRSDNRRDSADSLVSSRSASPNGDADDDETHV